MGASWKLQGEIDRVLKKVHWGVDVFDSIWNKVYDTENANQKEKFEADLKKEKKKLQRYRDQIKTWIQSSEIKDKSALMDARRQIEREMERFKVCEKETKTKAFSKEGLGQQPKTDPKEKAKAETRDWLNNVVSDLESEIDNFEAELEGLSIKKGKQRPHRLVHLEKSITRHKAHIKKLESILRLLDNDELSPEQVDDVKDFLEDYVERNQEDFEEFSDVEDLYCTLPMEKIETLEDMFSLAPFSLVKGVASISTSAVLSTESSVATSPTQIKENSHPQLNMEKGLQDLNQHRVHGPPRPLKMDGKASTAYNVLEHMLLDESEKPTKLPLSLLEAITNDFSTEQEIGRGGFAVVYKGILGLRTVAVKKLSGTVDMDEEKFSKEVQCLMKVRHKNIVRFLGYCADTQGEMVDYGGKSVMADVRNRVLCFEFVPNRSLHAYISDASCGLEWRARYQMIKGICEGLYYLHESRIVHLDLKPANILVDDNMVPKIADFGLSRCFDEKQSKAITLHLIGSIGYLAPEFYSGQITFKLDIYSLGVIIMEILTGEKGYSTVEKVLESWRDRIDISQGDIPLQQVRACTQIGTMCIDTNPANRPNTHYIIKTLRIWEDKRVH